MRRYIAGESPLAIALELKHLRLTAKQITSLAYREGWRELRIENLVERENRDPERILAAIRREDVEKLAQLVVDAFDDAERDQRMLSSNGWGLVRDAAGASSLMRAKKLAMDRLFTLFGISQQPQPQIPARGGLDFLLVEPISGGVNDRSKVVEAEATDVDPDLDDLEIEFDDEDQK